MTENERKKLGGLGPADGAAVGSGSAALGSGSAAVGSGSAAVGSGLAALGGSALGADGTGAGALGAYPSGAGVLPETDALAGADRQISDAYRAITGQTPFRYDLDGDALYQQYRDRYLQNARRGMRDTMGQAASLTGGFGNTYGQWVGQQAYDETLRGLTDLIPRLEQNAYARYQDREAERQQAYSNLSAVILRAGYAPDEQELAAAGMSRNQAEALRQAWIAANPGAAWLAGALTADQYFRLTGKVAPGAAPVAAAGGYGGGSGGGRGSSGKKSAAGKGEKKDALGAGASGAAGAGNGANDAEYLAYLRRLGLAGGGGAGLGGTRPLNGRGSRNEVK